MGCCQSRPPNESAVRMHNESNVIKASPENTKMAIDAQKTRGSKVESQKNESVGIYDERTKTKGKGIKKAVPEPQKIEKVIENIEDSQKENQSVVPASVRREEEKRQQLRNQNSKPTEENKIPKPETNKHRTKAEPPQPQKSDHSLDKQIEKRSESGRKPVTASEGSIPQPDVPKEDVHKNKPSSKKSIPKDEVRSESKLAESTKKSVEVKSPLAQVTKPQISKVGEEVKAPSEKHSRNAPQNQQVAHSDRSIDKSCTSKIADEYVGDVFGNIINDYSVHMKDQNQSIDQSSSIAYPQDSHDQSIEKRVSLNSSIDPAKVSPKNAEISEGPVSDVDKSSSTIRNIANDYVSDMVDKLL
ncbi:unnamed protein product [Moneuplotes crassus]|uniref:Uncharacterized protein n=1 Tax=Euplotes crassus TaxID=5936 RepID=A0AAD1XCK5_EUPCR|nr:unnamed protein product [Moneuplotes crassus]